MGEGVKSAVRELRLMGLHAEAGWALTLMRAAEALAKRSAQRLIATKVPEGSREPAGRRGCVRTNGLEEGWTGGQWGALIRVSAPKMDRLLDAFPETAVLGVPAPAFRPRSVARRVSQRPLRYDVRSDPVLPGWGTAMGHAILSCLPENCVRANLARTEQHGFTARRITGAEAILAPARQRRRSESIDEHIEGASGVAAPIRDAGGRPGVAPNVVTLTPRYRRQREFAHMLRAAAGRIETALFARRSAMVAASGD